TVLDLNFTSLTGGIGRLPDLPVFTITIPIRSDAPPGLQALLSFDATPAPWMDPQGNSYAVQFTPGTVTVAAAPWIQSVTPGGGVRPSGAVVNFDGKGSAPAATAGVSSVSY